MARMIPHVNRPGLRFYVQALALMAASVALADNGTLKLTVFPDVVLADGVSPVVITAEVRDQNGSLVPDGTQVLFESRLGIFDQNSVTTLGGVARTTLRAPNVAGQSHVRASVIRLNAYAEHSVEFVTDRKIIESSLKPVEIDGSGSVVYSVQDRLFEATGEKEGASLRYGRVTVTADELQFTILDNVVKARQATLTIGKVSRKYDELFFNVKDLTGVGFGQVAYPGRIVRTGLIATYLPPKVRRGYINITRDSEANRTTPVEAGLFKFKTVLNSYSTISASRATLIQDKAIQFQKATLKVDGDALMKQPYYELPLYVSNSSITEQFVSVNNNQLALSYPYYVGLNPGSTSLLRARYSSPFAGGQGYSAGTFLDYEMNWNRGDSGSGAFTVGGIGRDDWGASLRQSWVSSSRSIITATVDAPTHSSLLASLGYNQPLKGSTFSLSYGHSNSFSSFDQQVNTLYALWQTDSRKVGSLPLNVSYGVTASTSSGGGTLTAGGGTTGGIQAQFNSDLLPAGGLGSMRASYRVSELYTGGEGVGMSHIANLSLSTHLGSGWELDTGYDYQFDPFTTSDLGRQHLAMDSYFIRGPWQIHGSLYRSLDFDRTSTRLSVGRRISSLWSLDYLNTFDELSGDTAFEQTLSLGFKLGVRELGLTYSQRNRRLGIEIRSVQF